MLLPNVPPITLKLHLPPVSLPTQTATVLAENLTDWRIAGLPANVPPQGHLWQIAAVCEAAQPVDWRTNIEGAIASPDNGLRMSAMGQATNRPYTWPDAPTILALVPHWRCEPWLPGALASLSRQTHPPTQIVVIDDASPQPPLAIAQNFPNVTLLQAPERVGPYGLIQSVIDHTDYDAYLFQDADDWSSGDRLATLLQTARHHGAELVGSQEIRVLENPAQFQAVGYPLDVNQALRPAPGHPLLHPTSLVTRSLVQRLGGFATGLRFGGDTEFLLRAHWQARIVNSPRFCYFRRKRPQSLTTDLATGLDSPARQALTQQMKQRAIANAQAFAQGQPLDLRPMYTASAIALKHCCGPPLRWR
ncbi:MAG: glycosyltransferase family 2 protein [Cyanobacteria bacterium P01_G01_bin.54]